jgi:signal transduction histidine kinase
MLTIIVCGLIGLPSNHLSGLSRVLNIAVGSMVAFNICLYWLVRNPQRFRRIRWVAVVGNSLVLSVIWFLNGGLLGSIPAYSYCLNIAFICVFDRFHYQLLAGLVALLGLNILIEVYSPGLLMKYPSYETQFADVALAVLEGNFLFGLMAIQIKLRLQTALKDLAEKNQELESTLADLRESQNREREHLQLICHDLRNPVSSILSCIDLSTDQLAQLPQAEPSVEELRDTLRTIELCSNRSLELIEMLSFAQFLEQGATRADTEFDLRESLCHSLTVAASHARLKGQILVIQPASPREVEVGSRFYGSQSLLELLWQNLLDNAIKYSPRSSQIEVELEVVDKEAKVETVGAGDLPPNLSGYYLVKVMDKGQGLPAEELQLLFKKFGRASSVPTDGESSTGLGLYICKKIVELHGGSIAATSPGSNQGLTISVMLPVPPTR